MRRSKRGSAGRMHLSEPLCPLLLSYTFKCLYAWHLLYIRVFKCMACIILQNMNIRPWVCFHYAFKCLYAWLLLASMLATLLYACLLPSTLRVLWNTSDLLRRAAWNLLAQGSTRRGPRRLAILRLRPWASWSHLGAVLDIWATCRCSCTRPSSCGTTSTFELRYYVFLLHTCIATRKFQFQSQISTGGLMVFLLNTCISTRKFQC